MKGAVVDTQDVLISRPQGWLRPAGDNREERHGMNSYPADQYCEIAVIDLYRLQRKRSQNKY